MCFLKRLLPFALTLIVGVALISLTAFVGSFLRKDRAVQKAEQVNNTRAEKADEAGNDTTPAIIYIQPSMQLTETALRKRAHGFIKLRVLLDWNGAVSEVHPISTMSYGLTGEAITAAWSIQFAPATVRGAPTSVWMEIEHEIFGSTNTVKTINNIEAPRPSRAYACRFQGK